MNADPTFPLMFLACVVGFAVGTVLSSFIAAIWLQLAMRWLGFGKVEYFTAFKCVLVSSLTVVVLHFSIGFNHGFAIASLDLALSNSPSSLHDSEYGSPRHQYRTHFTDEEFSQRRVQPSDLASMYSPIYFLHATALGILVTAVFFGRMLPAEDDGSRISFRDSVVIASLYHALLFGCLLVVGLLVLSYILGIKAM